MKRLIQYSFIIVVLMGLAGCEKDSTLDTSSVTSFADFEIIDGAQNIVGCTSGFNDPGVVVTENSQPIDHTQATSVIYFGGGDADYSVPNNYQITYKAVNTDGFEGEAKRDVFVACTGDMVTSIEGLYVSKSVRVTGEEYGNLQYVIIRSAGNDVYEISHALGGFYQLGRGFGLGFEAQGATITALDIPGNSFETTSGVITGFGLEIEIGDLIVDPSTKTITFHASGNFGNGNFDITLNQVSI